MEFPSLVPSAIGAADLDTDGVDEVLVASSEAGEATLWVVANGTDPKSVGNVELGASPSRIVHGDYEGDGDQDVMVFAKWALAVFTNDAGVLSNEPILFTGPVGFEPADALGVADVDGDGVAEYFGFPLGGDPGIVYAKQGDTLVESGTVPGLLPCSLVGDIATGDVNGDERGDIIVLALGCEKPEDLDPMPLKVLAGQEDGTLLLTGTYAAEGLEHSELEMGDFDGDGDDDIAVLNLDTDTVSLLMGDGVGSFVEVDPLAATGNAWSLVSSEFDDDPGDELLLVVDETLQVSWGLGDESTVVEQYLGTELSALSWNSDGVGDLALRASLSEGSPGLLLLFSNP